MIEQEILQGLVATRDKLKIATRAFYDASIHHLQVKSQHDKTLAVALAEGTLTGKNEDARYGSFVLAYPELVADLEGWEVTLARARQELELARIDEAYFARLVQLATLVNGIGETDG